MVFVDFKHQSYCKNDLDRENKVALNQSELVWGQSHSWYTFWIGCLHVVQKPSGPILLLQSHYERRNICFHQQTTPLTTYVYIYPPPPTHNTHSHDMQRAKQHCQWAACARGRDTSNGIIHDFHRIVPGGLPSNKAQGLPPCLYIYHNTSSRVHEYQITHSLIHSYCRHLFPWHEFVRIQNTPGSPDDADALLATNSNGIRVT